ncbi:MAG TPA: ABC-F family ATP-binding cassette domain-containing protein [Longimicrobiales bacterium]|nr:ABC-F family ATP-binding cassette domain-containing protein [Longimicrobiales bacterium]
MISVSNLAKSFGGDTLFQGASFQLNPGSRYGLVGANGSGKTTLLNILTGDEEPSEGVVSKPARARLGVLRQDQFLYEDEQIIGVAMMGNAELWQAMVQKQEVLAHAHVEFDAERYAKLEETVERHDGYAAEARAAEILEGLGIPAAVHHQPLSTLSGGFKLRVLLAQALASTPDALLLDEPTNHLDILSIRWLERFLKAFTGPVVVISHDHRFLDNVCTHILDVDYATVTLYHGDYTHFQQAKIEERERREKDIESREKEIAHHQKFVDRFKAKASKARQAQSKLRMIEKKAESLESLPLSSRRWPTFRFQQKRHSGREVLELEAIRKSYGENDVLHGVDLSVQRGDRVAIIGPNGIGKSTLLRIAMGEVEATDGTIEWGYETQPGYFAQDQHERFKDAGGTVEEWLMHEVDAPSRGHARAALGMVLFSGDEAEKPLPALSGGEATRLEFARLAYLRPNVLVLDEPTNHLDLESIESLIEGLREFDGTLIFVSHDRWFVGQLATRIVEIKADGIRDYRGTYDEYIHASGDDHLDVDRVVTEAREQKRKERAEKGDGRRTSGNGRGAAAGDGPAEIRRSGASDPKRAARLAARRDELMAEIETTETRLAAIDETFADPALYEASRAREVRRLDEERAELRSRLENLVAEWESVERELEAAPA